MKAGRAAGALFCGSALIHGLVWLGYRSDPFAVSYVSDAHSYDRLASATLDVSVPTIGASSWWV